MTTFTVLTGSAIAKGIVSFAKAATTFKAKEHQLAYSALNHAVLHNDPKYLNALYAATPTGYRGGLRTWTVAFGPVSFDDKAENGPFTYQKGKTSDLPGAMAVAPADYAKESKASAPKAFDEAQELERVYKRFSDNNASARTLSVLKSLLNQTKVGLVASSEAPEPAKVVKSAPKAKTVKAKTVKVPAIEMAAAA